VSKIEFGLINNKVSNLEPKPVWLNNKVSNLESKRVWPNKE